LITPHLEFDAAQARVAAQLDSLRTRLLQSDRSRGIFGRLSRRMSGADWQPERGLYIWGGVGRGKTKLMNQFYDSLRFRKRERTHFYRFMREVHAELRAVPQRTDPLDLVAERVARRVRVLCLDELFVADIADAMILAGLFQGLIRRGVTLVATSNLAPQDLYKDGLQRQRFLPAIELLQTHLEVVHLDGGVDYRLRQLETAPTYLDSNDVATPTALRTRFAEIAGGSVPPIKRVHIEGRSIAAIAAGAGIAWFEFSELCDGPRSQNDYIELARIYQTLFISNIPRFDRDQDNAARRFIMLIDESYDRGVKIVVSAAAAPAALYQGEALNFEFQRASSRLIEMQTTQYLARPHLP
jgi:cell division protein ZapE